ncbi:MAG: hypothetical protein JW807_17815 [Spirochaetes bacterium]|nr:hypothetical protein [Spirochaetota bacterium]
MKKILLVTSRNNLYRDPLTKGGYHLTEYNLPLSSEAFREIELIPSFSAAITETSPETAERDGGLLTMLRKKGKVLCFIERMSDDLPAFLQACGISDVLTEYDASRFLHFMKVFAGEQAGGAGSFIILDNAGPAATIIANIITRFNYRAEFVAGVDELVAAAQGPGARFILVNLAARDLDLNGMVRKCSASKAVRELPVLAYKDLREGLFVHELVGGLNRLTRYILDPDELYSILVDILFRKELIPVVASLKRLSQLDANAIYDEESLSRAFFSVEKNIFNQPNILDEETISSLKRAARALHTALLKAESLRWLKIEMDRRDISTAGTGE